MTMPTIQYGGTHPTGEDSFVAPNSEKPLSKAPTAQISRLKTYLEEHFPDEVARSNTQHGEAPCDLAIRLLDLLSTRTPPTQMRRCGVAYCNKIDGHTDIHGHVEGL